MEYTGWVIRGSTGYPATLLEEGPEDSEAGPGSPTGAGVGGLLEPDVQGTLQHQPTPAGPGRSPLVPSLAGASAFTAPGQ